MKNNRLWLGHIIPSLTLRIALVTLLLAGGFACDKPGMGLEDDLSIQGSELSQEDELMNARSEDSDASLPHTNLTELDMPINVAYELTTYDCSNNPGPQISFSGLASTAGFGVRTIFRNNMKGTHEHMEEAMVDVELQSAGEEIVIPKQPVLGGTGGNPFIWIQFMDAQGNPASEEIFIGRCVQGYSFKGAQRVDESAMASSAYTVDGCENSPGPNITFDAGFSLSGLNAVVIFRNNDNPVGGPHEATTERSNTLEVIADGTAFTFHKQPVLGGVGGNPWIWTQFLNGSAESMSDEILLGRCEQLSKYVAKN